VDEEQEQEGKQKEVNERVMFRLKLHIGRHTSRCNSMLHWLKAHPLVSLDPRVRWVVSGIICRLTDYTLDGDTVSIRFSFRMLRISGYKYGHNYGSTDENNSM